MKRKRATRKCIAYRYIVYTRNMGAHFSATVTTITLSTMRCLGLAAAAAATAAVLWNLIGRTFASHLPFFVAFGRRRENGCASASAHSQRTRSNHSLSNAITFVSGLIFQRLHIVFVGCTRWVAKVSNGHWRAEKHNAMDIVAVHKLSLFFCPRNVNELQAPEICMIEAPGQCDVQRATRRQSMKLHPKLGHTTNAINADSIFIWMTSGKWFPFAFSSMDIFISLRTNEFHMHIAYGADPFQYLTHFQSRYYYATSLHWRCPQWPLRRMIAIESEIDGYFLKSTGMFGIAPIQVWREW